MIDRELLELAAKAAGYELFWGATDAMIRCHEPAHPMKTHNVWNPLEDDGDALRLAVQLGMIVDTIPTGMGSMAFFGRPLPTPRPTMEDVRRAIVNAAAHKGEWR
jgi:hypothetical protein